MDIKLLKNVLSVMDGVGINEAVLEPNSSGGTRIRAANKDRNIIVFDEISDHLVDMPMGIQSVRGLLSRINLFDAEKASMTFTDNGEIIRESTIKMGRKRAGFKFARPDKLGVPKMIPGDLSMETFISFSDEYVKYLSTAITAMSYTGDKKERTISLLTEGDDSAIINIYDGEDDSFNDTIEDCPISVSEKASWEVVPFERVLKSAVDWSETNTAKLSVTEHHIAVFEVGTIKVMVGPIV